MCYREMVTKNCELVCTLTRLLTKLCCTHIIGKRSKECYSADFDTFTERGIWRRGRILEGGMADKAGAAISLRLVGFQEDDLFRCHLREVPPFMVRRVTHHIIFSITVSVTEVKLEEVFGLCRSNVAHRQRSFLDYTTDRLPDIEEGNTTRKQVLSIVLEKLTHSKQARFRSIVAMYQHHRGALRSVRLVSQRPRCVGLGTDGVVEDKDTLGACCLLQKVNDLGVEGRSNALVIFPLVVSGLKVVE